ncbi:MAG TPA: anti-sigma factor [Chloroflexota bacterium]|nr:anti-sigma factor [Chloroflexota bacterium]
MMDCAAADDLLAAFALGAATPEEARELQQHLASCDKHPQLAGFWEIAAMLPSSVPPVTPRDQVKHRLMARVYTDLAPVHLRRLWWQRTWSMATAAVLAVLALGLGIRDWGVSQKLANAPISFGLAPLGSAARASGTLVFLPQQNSATLVLQQLPQLPADRVYEVWLVKGSTSQPAGVFKPSDDGSASIIVKGTPSGYDHVAVTEEAGPQGSAVPTGQPFVGGSLK